MEGQIKWLKTTNKGNSILEMSQAALAHMQTALRLAKYALDHGETPVACVMVHTPTNKLIAYGMNDTNKSLTGIAHAEFMAIEQVQEVFGRKDTSIFKDITLYVTVEPCIMCASALKQLGIGSVVFGCGNERFGGNGSILSIHKDSSTSPENRHLVIPGLLRREAIMLLRYFYVRENDKAPKPRTKSTRKLDKETFPAIDWSIYLTAAEFEAYYGKDKRCSFENNTDINEDIDWKVINSSNDSLIQELDCLRNDFKMHSHKRHKR
ncbi:HGL169Wp [Eremothecium sinecaudum]|uniref:tRNA(adenine(34)) deaminase n=1 Tax=Eremothecium sinecaudum TaxID=45286 RepID=A0A120K2P6_9SACH|nr:HGL169Wp [Eremothecium sinecaudum]AMD22171.1 HGL169Wp [Eremothecium sinecaudum]